MPEADALNAIVTETLPRLRAMTEEASQHAPAEGKWSPRQIIGHLIDSAANNHQRFVRFALEDQPHLPGYAQDRWVEFQAYQTADWQGLLELWSGYNLLLVQVMAQVRPEQRGRTGRIGEGPDVTLAFVMQDYVAHLKHHLTQVLGQ